MSYISKSLPNLQKLRILNLDGNNITDKGGWEIVNSIKEILSINSLSLGRCDSGSILINII